MNDNIKEAFDLVVGYLMTNNRIDIDIETTQAVSLLDIISPYFPRIGTVHPYNRPYKIYFNWIAMDPREPNTLSMYGFCKYPGEVTTPFALQIPNQEEIYDLLKILHILIMIQELEDK